MIALDTNLLVYAHRSNSPLHAKAVAALRAAASDRAGWGVALPVVGEFWRVVTHPALPSGPSTPSQAHAFLGDLWRGGAACWLPLARFKQRWTALAQSLGIRGNRIFDLQIALLAAEAGARVLWTHDHGFIGAHGLPLHDPLAA